MIFIVIHKSKVKEHREEEIVMVRGTQDHVEGTQNNTEVDTRP